MDRPQHDERRTVISKESSPRPTILRATMVPAQRRYELIPFQRIDWDTLQASSARSSSARSSSARSSSAQQRVERFEWGSERLARRYQRLLERVEQRIGVETVAGLLLLIRASLRDLSIDELASIGGCSSETVDSLIAELRNHIAIRRNRIALLNDHFGNAIIVRYGGADGESLADARKRIRAYASHDTVVCESGRSVSNCEERHSKVAGVTSWERPSAARFIQSGESHSGRRIERRMTATTLLPVT
jgi:hypothetical protein